jgi:hypothetical protein
LLLAAMIVERRATRPARKRYLLVRLVVATIAGATVLAISAPAVAGWPSAL